MIERLRFGTTAHFFVTKRRLSARAISTLFGELRRNASAPSRNLFRHDREAIARAHWSAISFFYERPVSFLIPPPPTKERVCGFMLLVEYANYVAVFKSNLGLPAPFKTRYLGRVPAVEVEAAIARSDAIFERIRLRNMSTSKGALRSKTLEAIDLQNAVGPSGASRYVPQSYSVRREDGQYTATPNTGRIAQRSERCQHEELVRWAIAVIDQLGGSGANLSSFIQTFARPIDFASAAATLRPTYFTVNAASLAEGLEAEGARLVRRTEAGFVELSPPETADAIAALDIDLPVHKSGGVLKLQMPEASGSVGRIAIGKNRIALRDLTLGDTAGLFVESIDFTPGEDPDRKPLRSYIDKQ